MTGLSRYFARVDPNVALVLADPQGSGLSEYITTGQLGKSGPSVVEGIGSGAIPPVADLSRVHHAFTIPDAESLHVARELLRIAGILAGSSSGTLVAGALRYCREQTAPCSSPVG